LARAALELAALAGVGAGLALGIGLDAWSYYDSPYYSDCRAWNGYRWVNMCYGYPYN
jgi:hypothetical protein